MHLHQVHFLVYAVNGTELSDQEWVDTANVSYGGSVDMIVDFTNPAIRGMSVFHCHLLNHEDKGMMAKILLKQFPLLCTATSPHHHALPRPHPGLRDCTTALKCRNF